MADLAILREDIEDGVVVLVCRRSGQLLADLQERQKLAVLEVMHPHRLLPERRPGEFEKRLAPKEDLFVATDDDLDAKLGELPIAKSGSPDALGGSAK